MKKFLKRVLVLLGVGLLGLALGSAVTYNIMKDQFHPIKGVFCAPNNHVILQFEMNDVALNYETVLPCDGEYS